MASDETTFIGVCLGWDFTAEHEWGIERIQDEFDIDPKTFKINKCPNSCILNVETVDNERITTLVFEESYIRSRHGNDPQAAFNDFNKCYGEELSLPNPKYTKRDPNLATAWDSRSFAVRVRGKEYGQMIQSLHISMLRLDACIWLGQQHPENPFERAGLLITIPSVFTIPTEK
jgi:hypothetical protein